MPDPDHAGPRRRPARNRALAAGTPGGGLETLSWQALQTYDSGADTALVAYVLLLAGLAAKIVGNGPQLATRRPRGSSPPVSALLSAALLPAVLLVAWRSEQSLAPVVGSATAQGILIGFGLVSLAVAVPFLWRPLAWKRLLAYSSLEHMGVIALGIGFATLALAGVAVHIVAHAVAKALGFYAAVPLLGHEPRAAGHSVTGIARTKPALGTTDGDLHRRPGRAAALPAVRERGANRGRRLPVRTHLGGGGGDAAARARLPRSRPRPGRDDRRKGAPPRPDTGAGPPGCRRCSACVVLLLVLSGVALWLPGSDLVEALLQGVA